MPDAVALPTFPRTGQYLVGRVVDPAESQNEGRVMASVQLGFGELVTIKAWGEKDKGTTSDAGRAMLRHMDTPGAVVVVRCGAPREWRGRIEYSAWDITPALLAS
jgi:hypothetical protein